VPEKSTVSVREDTCPSILCSARQLRPTHCPPKKEKPANPFFGDGAHPLRARMSPSVGLHRQEWRAIVYIAKVDTSARSPAYLCLPADSITRAKIGPSTRCVATSCSAVHMLQSAGTSGSMFARKLRDGGGHPPSPSPDSARARVASALGLRFNP